MISLQSTKYPCHSAWPHKSALATALGSDKKISLKNDVLQMFWLDTRICSEKEKWFRKNFGFAKIFAVSKIFE